MYVTTYAVELKHLYKLTWKLKSLFYVQVLVFMCLSFAVPEDDWVIWSSNNSNKSMDSMEFWKSFYSFYLTQSNLLLWKITR